MHFRNVFILPIDVTRRGLWPACVLASIALACSSNVNPPDGIGEARMEVTQVPPGVGCLHVVAAATRAVQFDFNVSPGASSVMNLTGIPTGRVDFSASAFPMQCPPAPSTVATWVSDPVTVIVGAGVVANVTLAMHPNGRARVGVDFGNEPPCAPVGAGCQNPSACCSSVCVADPSGMGTCAPANGGTCVAPSVPCPGTAMGGVTCVDVGSDPANCGMCGNACPAGASCVSGMCATTCSPPSVFCAFPMGGRCVDPTSDSSNCGQCANSCSPGSGCIDGACDAIGPVACPAPLLLCPGMMGPVCSDRFADANNCGACGNHCPPGSQCLHGMCDGPCAAPRQVCMGPAGVSCSNLSTDATNCGTCGTACPAGRACISGVCR